MRIAVNTRFLRKDYLEGYGYFIHELFRRITVNNPGHEFIFISDQPPDARFIYSKNITPVVAGPPARHPLLWKFWYDIRIPWLLKKYKADLFVSCDGFASLRCPVPQCLVLHDLAYLHYPAGINRTQRAFYKRFIPQFIRTADRVLTVSEFSRKDIVRHFPFAADKTAVLYNGIRPEFRPLDWETKQTVKEKYTGGKEYFLYTGSVHPRKNLMGLLKAFSLFKKRQQSSLRLVIAGRLAWQYASFTESLATYKYRSDVILTGYLPEAELAALTGAAYALVYPSFFEGFGLPVAEAMQAGVPVICSEHSAMEEIAAGAALLANPSDPASIAEKMMRLYKDESLRAGLIAKGTARARAFSWENAATQFMKELESCIR